MTITRFDKLDGGLHYGQYEIVGVPGGYGVYYKPTGEVVEQFTDKGSDFKNRSWAQHRASKLELYDLDCAVSMKRGYFIIAGA